MPVLDTAEDVKARLLRRLGVVVDLRFSHHVRRAAVLAIQNSMDGDHPLRWLDPDELVFRVLDPWAERAYYAPGSRGPSVRRVTRPPLVLSDVWSY